MILVNGRADANVPALDRGLMYGDGVFRTLRVQAGAPLWWEEQLARLAQDATRLGIPHPAQTAWEADVCTLTRQGPADCVLKLVLTRGPAGRGYLPPQRPQPTRLAMTAPLPPDLERVAQSGATVRVCALRLAEQPRLAGVKHLNRLENVLARGEWDDPGIHEGLLMDTAGRVVCGVSSNVFVLRGGELSTPRLDRCGVSGVTRARLMRGAARLKLAVREADITLDELLAADEVMLTNSLIKLWRVARLGTRTWDAPVLSLELRALLDAL